MTALAMLAGALLAAAPAAPLDLARAETIALANHPQVSAALLSAVAANQVVREVRSVLAPQAVANVTGADAATGTRLAAGAINNPSVFDRTAAGLAVSQLITDFGRTAHLVASARLKARSEETGVSAARNDVLVQVDLAFLAALKADAVLSVARETLKARELLRDQVSQLAKEQLKGSLDVSIATVAYDDARLLLSRAGNDRDAARAALAQAMGTTEAPDVLAEPALPPPPPPDASPLVREALAVRPDLAALRLQTESADQFARAEADLSNPTVSALANAGVVDGDPRTFRDPYSAVALNVSVPVFNGGLFDARKKEARARASGLDARVHDLENRVTSDVRVAWLNASNAYDRLTLAADQLKAANEAYALTRGRYDMGLSSIVDLAQSLAQRTAAEIQQASARYDAMTQTAVLRHHVGRPR